MGVANNESPRIDLRGLSDPDLGHDVWNRARAASKHAPKWLPSPYSEPLLLPIKMSVTASPAAIAVRSSAVVLSAVPPSRVACAIVPAGVASAPAARIARCSALIARGAIIAPTGILGTVFTAAVPKTILG
jgi:hypothetical protein